MNVAIIMLILYLFIALGYIRLIQVTIIVCINQEISLLILLSSTFSMIDVYSSRFGQGLCQASSSLDSLPFKFFVIHFVALG